MNNKFEALTSAKTSNQETDRLKAEDSDDEEEPFRPAPKPGEGEHPLQYNYAIWFSRRSQNSKSVQYDKNLKFIASFASVEQFWNIYSYIVRPGDMSGHVDYHLFKEGIRPMWEDDANKHGGKWIIRLKKGLASRCWENLIMAMLGEQFMVGEEICGAVISIRYQDDILSLWNRSNDSTITSRIRDTLQRVLNLPPHTIMEYKEHTESIKDQTSFRNTNFVR
ncbi:eukaryotic translation initiation factor 4E type 2-like isoform X1 [Biomphalaria glabrata]|uniref:Eukaryotic translation initiation factor 4E type 2-like isoform X1 n=1 Tax=Biomphalaria glabrata TaxID=6526 RepID=A0A9W2Z1K8_BIOGL|nr:eukaryotic translation initiation factor 4E type 2-like isoform X1 [Biomphalaria glabrata]